MSFTDKLIIPLKNRVRYSPRLRGLVTRRVVNMDFPAVIGVDPTNRCNLKCTFCGPNKMDAEKGTMEWDLYKTFIDECKRHRTLCMLILHNFGEPLMNNNIVRMVAYAKEQRVARSVQFSSNGTLLDEETACGLIKTGLDGFVFSVDAYTRQAYHALKGVDKLEKVIENAKMMMQLKQKLGSRTPHVSAKMVRQRSFENTFKPFLKMWGEIVDEAILTPYSNWGNKVDYKGCEQVPDNRYACHFLWYYPVVNWDGRVYFCCATCHDDAVIGDLRKSSMSSIWKGKLLHAVRITHLNGRTENIRTCDKCTYWAESRVNLDKWLMKKMRIR